jgi:ornithine carbamoyltransferase
MATPMPPAFGKDFLSLLDLTPAALSHLIALAAGVKQARAGRRPGAQPLTGKHVALLFEKPSLRTRITFVLAVRELGGDVVELPDGVLFGARESPEDVARNLERWVDGIVVRTFAHAAVERLAAAAPRLHVVNALTDEEHPCQALADVLTLSERLGPLAGRTLAFVGDGNNVATSVTQAAVMSGMHVRLAAPSGYALPEGVLAACRAAAVTGATVTLTDDPEAAVAGADVVYTDVWTSMGQEAEEAQRNPVFQRYQVNERLISFARPGALFMHCLPAHRGAEVTDAVIDSPVSVVFDQAENRLHVQKALLSVLMRDDSIGDR